MITKEKLISFIRNLYSNHYDPILQRVEKLRLYRIIESVDKLFSRIGESSKLGKPYWGYECEYDPYTYNRYVKKYILLRFIENVILDGHDDGSGPRELASPPMNILSIEELKWFNTLLYALNITFESEIPYDGYDVPCGRHVHVNIFVDNEYSMYCRFCRYVALLTPFMANTISDSRFYYRKAAIRYAGAYIYKKYVKHSRDYFFVTWNDHGTFEIRLNESSPVEAWFVAISVYVLVKYGAKGLGKYRLSIQSIRQIIRYGIGYDDHVKNINGESFRFGEGFDALTNYVLDRVQQHEDKVIYGIAKKIVNNVSELRKVMNKNDMKTMYPELLDMDTVNELESDPQEIVIS